MTQQQETVAFKPWSTFLSPSFPLLQLHIREAMPWACAVKKVGSLVAFSSAGVQFYPGEAGCQSFPFYPDHICFWSFILVRSNQEVSSFFHLLSTHIVQKLYSRHRRPRILEAWSPCPSIYIGWESKMERVKLRRPGPAGHLVPCLLYTSDAADEDSSV